MRTIEIINNTIAVKLDETGNPIESFFLPENSGVATNDLKLKVNELTTKEVDYALIQAAENGLDSDLIVLESEPRSTASDEAVLKLINKGKTIITVV